MLPEQGWQPEFEPHNPWWKERINFLELSFDLHTCYIAHTWLPSLSVSLPLSLFLSLTHTNNSNKNSNDNNKFKNKIRLLKINGVLLVMENQKNVGLRSLLVSI